MLRRKGCSSLRKAHLFFLARIWGYQSEIWCRRSERRAHLQRTEPCRAERLGAADPPYPAPPSRQAGGYPRPGAAGGFKRPRSLLEGGAPPKSARQDGSDGLWDDMYNSGAFPTLFGGSMDDQRAMVALQPRMGAARSTAGGIRAWSVDVRMGPLPTGPNEEREPLMAIDSNITLALRPMADQSNALFRGSAEADSRSGTTSLSAQREKLVPALQAAADWLNIRGREFHRALLGLRARAAELDDKARGTVAWLQLLGAECPLEVEMLKLQEGLHRMTVDMVAAGDDVVQGALIGLELIAHCQSLAMQTKFVTYGTYCKVTIQLKELMSDYTFRITDSLRARADRLSAPLPTQLGFFFQHPSMAPGGVVSPFATSFPAGNSLSGGVESVQRMAQVLGLLGDGEGDAATWGDGWLLPHAPDVVGTAVQQEWGEAMTGNGVVLKQMPRAAEAGVGDLQLA